MSKATNIGSGAKADGVSAKPWLSVIVITLNEEDCIERCLRSVGFADEIIVVDSGSTDRTCEIARSLGAKVIVTGDWPGFGAQKNRALAAASGTWILSLDADEWVDPPLAAEIVATVSNHGGNVGFQIPRRSRFCGHIVKHGTWSPDLVLRLFRRESGRFTYSPVHEKVILEGQSGRLHQELEHDCITDLDDALRKIRQYSDTSAAQLQKRGVKNSTNKAFWRALWTYFNCYVIKRGVLDGSVGLLVAAYSAKQTYQKWANEPSARAIALVDRNASPVKPR